MSSDGIDRSDQPLARGVKSVSLQLSAYENVATITMLTGDAFFSVTDYDAVRIHTLGSAIPAR